MNHPVQWETDLSDALHCRDVIDSILRQMKCLRDQRGELRRLADRLHDLVEAFQRHGLADRYEAVYLCLFDSLSYLVAAIGQYLVNPRLLAQARDELARLDSVADWGQPFSSDDEELAALLED